MRDPTEFQAVAKELSELRQDVLALARLTFIKSDADTSQATGILAARAQKLTDRIKFGPPQLELRAPEPKKENKR